MRKAMSTNGVLTSGPYGQDEIHRGSRDIEVFGRQQSATCNILAGGRVVKGDDGDASSFCEPQYAGDDDDWPVVIANHIATIDLFTVIRLLHEYLRVDIISRTKTESMMSTQAKEITSYRNEKVNAIPRNASHTSDVPW